MGKDRTKGPGAGGPEKERPAAGPHGGGGHDDPCRCKQVSLMTPRQLFGTMLNDLAFWKKGKKK